MTSDQFFILERAAKASIADYEALHRKICGVMNAETATELRHQIKILKGLNEDCEDIREAIKALSHLWESQFDGKQDPA